MARAGDSFKVIDPGDTNYGRVGTVHKFARGVIVLEFKDHSFGSYPPARVRDVTKRAPRPEQTAGQEIADRQRMERKRRKRKKVL